MKEEEKREKEAQFIWSSESSREVSDKQKDNLISTYVCPN